VNNAFTAPILHLIFTGSHRRWTKPAIAAQPAITMPDLPVPTLEAQPTRPHHVLPTPFTNSHLEVLTQGAEALVYKTTFLSPSIPCVLKYRPPKPYRHPTLDKRLSKARLLAEARVLVRCRKEGVKVPAVLGGDWENGWLVLEFIEGRTVRRVLDDWVESVRWDESVPVEEAKPEVEGEGGKEELKDLMARIGRAIGRLHEFSVVHGDLTTSNLMLRPPKSGKKEEETNAHPPASISSRQTVSAQREAAMNGPEPPELLDPPEPPPSKPEPDSSSSLAGDIILIDFGLASQAPKQAEDEDRAVDLYVLERAFAATHPSMEAMFQEVLRVYGGSYKGAAKVLRRLGDVRLRGRKKSMLG
jgi:TP53 regulating kinase-like protein